MFLTVDYYRLEDGNLVKCWTLLPLTHNLDDAIDFAHLGFDGPKAYLGATAFRVVDSNNKVLAAVSRHAGRSPRQGSLSARQ